MRTKKFKFLFLVSLLLISINASTSKAVPSRDHLTEQEAGLVADAQELDKRIAVFTKIIERRFLLITNPNATQSKKEQETFGDFPKGKRTELLSDIAKIIDESISNIESVNDKDSSNPLIEKSLRKFGESCKGFVTQLSTMLNQTKDEGERRAIERAIENAQLVIDAAKNLPAETKKK